MRKKFMVDVGEFEKWLSDRMLREKDAAFNVPTAADLIQRYGK